MVGLSPILVLELKPVLKWSRSELEPVLLELKERRHLYFLTLQ
jgi:hypothetical protein